MTFVRRLWIDDRGQDLVEYVLLGATVALAGLAAMSVSPVWPTRSDTSWDNAHTGAVVPTIPSELDHHISMIVVGIGSPLRLRHSDAAHSQRTHAVGGGGRLAVSPGDVRRSADVQLRLPVGSSVSCSCCPYFALAAWAAAT